jgi:hypothetical protein
MAEEILLPPIQSDFPKSRRNKGWFGKCRIDLPGEVEIYYYHGNYWTLAELSEYGALPQYKCIVCGKKLVFLPDGFRPDKRWHNLIWEIICNYGSSFDTRKFVIGVCDHCIEAALQDGRLIEETDRIAEALGKHMDYIDSCFEQGYKKFEQTIEWDRGIMNKDKEMKSFVTELHPDDYASGLWLIKTDEGSRFIVIAKEDKDAIEGVKEFLHLSCRTEKINTVQRWQE